MLILAYYKAHISTSTFISMSAGYKWICIKFYQRWVLPGYDQQLRSTCIWIRIWCKKTDIRKIEEMRDPLSFLVILFSIITEVSDQSKKLFWIWWKQQCTVWKLTVCFLRAPRVVLKPHQRISRIVKCFFILILVMSHCATVVVNWTLPHSCINSP